MPIIRVMDVCFMKEASWALSKLVLDYAHYNVRSESSTGRSECKTTLITGERVALASPHKIRDFSHT